MSVLLLICPICTNKTLSSTASKFTELPITTAHALRAGSLPIDHRDPFDRMIMAQAELESLPVITYDAAFQTGLIRVIADLK
jgi:PIN domain nuclease of toxin-antitoxin system